MRFRTALSALFIAALSAGPLGAAPPATVASSGTQDPPTRLVTSAAELKDLIGSTQSKLDAYKEKLSKSKEAAKDAPRVIEETIAQLDQLIARFDKDGDMRKDLDESKAFSEQKANEFASSNNPKLAAIAPRFQAQVTEFETLETESARLVKTANEQRRALADSKEALVALEQAKMMDDVILVFKDSLKSFDQVVTATQGYVAGVDKLGGGGL